MVLGDKERERERARVSARQKNTTRTCQCPDAHFTKIQLIWHQMGYFQEANKKPSSEPGTVPPTVGTLRLVSRPPRFCVMSSWLMFLSSPALGGFFIFFEALKNFEL